MMAHKKPIIIQIHEASSGSSLLQSLLTCATPTHRKHSPTAYMVDTQPPCGRHFSLLQQKQ